MKLPNDSYWILSSYQDYENDKTSEIFVNGDFYRGPDLPDTDPDLNQRTCSVQITDDLTLFSFESSYIYNATRGFWEPTGENIPYHARYSDTVQFCIYPFHPSCTACGPKYGRNMDDYAMPWNINLNKVFGMCWRT